MKNDGKVLNKITHATTSKFWSLKHWLCFGHRFFMIFSSFVFSHGQIYQFLKCKKMIFIISKSCYIWVKWRKVNLNKIWNRNDWRENFWTFFHIQSRLNKLDFPLIFTWNNYYALSRYFFQILENPLKSVSQAHPVCVH